MNDMEYSGSCRHSFLNYSPTEPEILIYISTCLTVIYKACVLSSATFRVVKRTKTSIQVRLLPEWVRVALRIWIGGRSVDGGDT